jgi:EAL domain-containing protein (putative c-di-GMP-specific phosphodiesterase class I)
LEEDELVLHYQPIVDRAGAVVMAEALVRWPHGEYGMLPPGAILQAARRGNLSERLDEYVLRTAVREAAAWSSQQSEPPAVAINVMSLPDGTRFTDRLTAAVEDAGLDWSRLVLEITETPLADLTEAGRAEMVGLAGRGVRFALDDFGTGYSSMSRLEQLPLHIIKVDRSFVVDLPTNSAHRAITAAVMAMASSMGYTCVAEGVETSAQLSALVNLGYVIYQGWLFCPAVPPHEFRTVLATSPLPMP